MNKTWFIVFILTATSVLQNTEIYSQRINAITSNRTALLGSAYQSEKEMFVGQQCVIGDTVYTGVAHSTFSFT